MNAPPAASALPASRPRPCLLRTTRDAISDAEFLPYRRVLAPIFERAALAPSLVELLLADRNLWRMTFTHKSVDAAYNYEALEFLGDSHLVGYVKQRLCQAFPQYFNSEGIKVIARLTSNLINKDTLAHKSRQLRFDSLLRVGQSAGHQRVSLLEDVFEAFVATTLILALRFEEANYLAFNLLYAVLDVVYPLSNMTLDNLYDPKTMLKELAEKRAAGQNPLGTVDYHTRFVRNLHEATCFLTRHGSAAAEAMGTGVHANKKEAEKRAAAEALLRLKEEGHAAKINFSHHLHY